MLGIAVPLGKTGPTRDGRGFKEIGPPRESAIRREAALPRRAEGQEIAAQQLMAAIGGETWASGPPEGVSNRTALTARRLGGKPTALTAPVRDKRGWPILT
jgi:hypothetical protein